MDETAQPVPKQPRVRDLFVWQSLSRPSFDYPRGTFLSLGSLVVFLTMVLILFQEWLAVAVCWAAYFLFFALSKIPQVTVEHKITTEGVVSLNHAHIWPELGPFWFTTRRNETILHIARRGFLGHLIILIDPSDQEKIRDTLAEYLPFIEVPEKSAFDKFSDWFATTILREKK